jgi:hypothetical protein
MLEPTAMESLAEGRKEPDRAPMASDPPVPVHDACVLYPFRLCNVLIRRTFGGFVEARPQICSSNACRPCVIG